jgi:hypothetical protein
MLPSYFGFFLGGFGEDGCAVERGEVSNLLSKEIAVW